MVSNQSTLFQNIQEKKKVFLKGRNRQCVGVDLRMQFCKEIFQDSFDPVRRFYGPYLFSKSENSILQSFNGHSGEMIFGNRFF